MNCIMTNHHTGPRARTDRLIVEELPNEILVYDVDTGRAHCLNSAAATVWRTADGSTSTAAIARSLEERHGLPADVNVVSLALRELDRAGLMDDLGEAHVPRVAPSRRDALKRLGLIGAAAVALPLVKSIVAPDAVAAVTCQPSGATCQSPTDCCSGVCLNTGKCQ